MSNYIIGDLWVVHEILFLDFAMKLKQYSSILDTLKLQVCHLFLFIFFSKCLVNLDQEDVSPYILESSVFFNSRYIQRICTLSMLTHHTQKRISVIFEMAHLPMFYDPFYLRRDHHIVKYCQKYVNQ